MTDKRLHRGSHPQDHLLFGPEQVPKLRAALADYCLLLTKGYAAPSSLKLVGDHFNLDHRQRLALMRSACSDQQFASRQNRRINLESAAGRHLLIDGYNLLITVEAALGGAPVFIGRDGCFRDLSGIHGTYRRVAETLPAAELFGDLLHNRGITEITWYLDTPVSNSGRLKTILLSTATRFAWPWQVILLANPDPVLAASAEIVASTDSVILDACHQWLNLAAHIITSELPAANLIDLS
jgi:hypothetical protein